MPVQNRRQAIETGSTPTPLVGIDFVEVDPAAQVELWVYFIGDAATVFAATPAEFTSAGAVAIRSLSDAASLPVVAVSSVAWAVRNGRTVLHVVTETPGDFSRYALTLSDSASPSRVDPYFNGVAFRFQAGCTSDLDCAPVAPVCSDVAEPDVPIDYTARDFGSFRRALFEFASLRWPSWTDRQEADLGVMLMEAMSALADDMSYYQDRVAREATLNSASERRSLRHHARLLDHELHDGLTAWTWIQVTVIEEGASELVPAGTPVSTAQPTDPAGAAIGEQIVFELGRGLSETQPTPVTYEVREVWNEIQAWVWDEDDTCLPAGAVSLDIDGSWVDSADSFWDETDRWVLLQTAPSDPSITARAHVVKLTNAVEVFDPVAGVTVTRLEWDASEATPWDLALEDLFVHANLVPAVAGRTVPAAAEPELLFRIANPTNPGDPPGWPFSPPNAVERQGPNGTVSYLLPLLETEHESLCFVGEAPQAARPELLVQELDGPADASPTPWEWRRSLIGSPTALPNETVYTLEDGLFDRVSEYFRGGPAPVRHVDYRTGRGFTLRFGDGSLGELPNADRVFRVVYRVGGGARANVGAHTLVETSLSTITVTNPLPVISGVDPESAKEVRQVAPEAWRALAYRAVRPEDYAEALERLPWVERAGASLRWTGSWLTLFGTPDPEGAIALEPAQREDAERQLDRFRQAGRETHVLDPVYGWLDLRITICVEPSSYRGEVQALVQQALFGSCGQGGFFDPDHFSFGEPLRRSALYAALQAVPGVRAVERIQIRRRGHFRFRDFDEEALSVGINEVVGVANDALYPERGAVTLLMEGGA